ncbi:GPR1/FUN34/YaaH-class plasma membrane protein [Colletotrichum sp. SAR 10_98]|nr:GPR1/FUN34/YaaH-class plasma membrane protein [Colletotrichum sp. SAR 10_98]
MATMDHKEFQEVRSHSHHNGHHRPPRGPPTPHANGYEYTDEYIHPEMSRDDALKRMKTAGSISISPELFEKLYLSPQNQVKGELRKTFGNPTPIAIVGFLISLTPLCCDLMGWRGAGGSGAAGIPTYFFFGGLLMFVGGLLEWVLGNTFPATVFTTFGAFWASFGGTLNPSFAAFSSYAPAGEAGATGLATKGFNASFGFITLAMGMICLVFLVCSLRTNIVFFVIFLTLVPVFGLITAAYWFLAMDFTGNSAFAAKLLEPLRLEFFATMSLKRKRPMEDIFQSRQITFVIGKEQKEYSIHESAFSLLSRPLEALLTGGMQESQNAKVIWGEVEDDVFFALVDFAYHGSYPPPSLRKIIQQKPSSDMSSQEVSSSESSKDDVQNESENQTFLSIISWMSKGITWVPKYDLCKDKFNQGQHYQKPASTSPWAQEMKMTDRTGYTDVFMLHARLYVLADIYAMEQLHVCCLRRIRISFLNVTPNAELLETLHDLIVYAFENTKASDGFRKLLHHFCIAQMEWLKSNGFLERMREELPEFLADLAVEIPFEFWAEASN